MRGEKDRIFVKRWYKMRGLKITSLTVMYVVLGLLMAFSLYNVGNKVFGNVLPNYFGYSLLCMSNDSSFFIAGGELVIVERVPSNSVKEDELLVFDFGGEMAVSSVKHVLDGGAEQFGGVKENGGGYITYAKIFDSETGQMNEVINAAVSFDEVYGKVVYTVPAVGNLLSYLTSWQFNILLLTIFVIIIWSNVLLLNIKISVTEDRAERIRANEEFFEKNKIDL